MKKNSINQYHKYSLVLDAEKSKENGVRYIGNVITKKENQLLYFGFPAYLVNISVVT